MSGFHPVLGLLAVAVCISYTEGAPFSAVQKDDIVVHKLHKTPLHHSLPSARNDGPLPNALYQENKKISKRDYDSQNTKVIDERNYKNLNPSASFAKLKNLRSRGAGAVLTKSDVRNSENSGSGEIGKATNENEGILSSVEPSASQPESSSESEESDVKSNESDKSVLDSGLTGSGSEENCDEGEGSDVSTSSTLISVSEKGTAEDTTMPSPTTQSNNEVEATSPDDECEDEEENPGSDAISSESSGSDSQGSQENEESEECEEPVDTTPTVTTQRSKPPTTTRPKKRPNDENSSGSFNDSDSHGVEFSESNSLESKGRSTEFND